MELALKRYKVAADAEADYRKDAKSDTMFYCAHQWDDDAKNARGNRPCLVINRLPQFTRQITNELRQNMPSITIIPANDGTEDVANIINGIVRHIQESSHASVAYSTANNAQVIAGKGYFRIITDYCNDKSFDQEIKIARIKNALSVYCDPASVEPDESDAMYKFITADISHAEFIRQYPDKEVVDNTELTSKGDEIRAWAALDKDSMRIAEYFTVEEKDDKEIYRLADGTQVDTKPKDGEYDTRMLKKRKVMWRKMSAVEILDSKEWAGKYIPIVPVLGEDIDVDGKRVIKGMVRDAKDPQRMYNYMTSASAEAIALAPKAPFIMAEGQQEGYEEMWANANTKNYSTLIYNPKSIGGQVIGAPQRNQAEPPIQAMNMALQQYSEDLKAITGIHDASLGARSNEVSGKAIQARTMQGDVANYHYKDNLSYSLMYAGKVILDLIPKIYDGARVVRILGADGTSDYKKINQPSDEKDANGQPKVFDLTIGEYDIVVDTGPSYKTKRAEDSANMAALLSNNPDLWKVIGDLAVKAMDWPDAQQIGDRLKKTLPPELQDDDTNEELPIKVKQQLVQLTQQNKQLTQTIHAMADTIDSKTLELESRERIAYSKNETDLVIKSMGMQGDANHALLEAELGHVAAEQARVHQIGMQQLTAQNQQTAQQDANQNQQVMQQSTQDHVADIQQSQQDFQSEAAAQQPSQDANQP